MKNQNNSAWAPLDLMLSLPLRLADSEPLAGWPIRSLLSVSAFGSFDQVWERWEADRWAAEKAALAAHYGFRIAADDFVESGISMWVALGHPRMAHLLSEAGLGGSLDSYLVSLPGVRGQYHAKRKERFGAEEYWAVRVPMERLQSLIDFPDPAWVGESAGAAA